MTDDQEKMFESQSSPILHLHSLSVVDCALIDSDAYTDYEDCEFEF